MNRSQLIGRVQRTDVELGDKELDNQLCKLMVVQERRCTSRVERRQLQRARASRGVALAVYQGSALGLQARKELDKLDTTLDHF